MKKIVVIEALIAIAILIVLNMLIVIQSIYMNITFERAGLNLLIVWLSWYMARKMWKSWYRVSEYWKCESCGEWQSPKNTKYVVSICKGQILSGMYLKNCCGDCAQKVKKEINELSNDEI